MEHAQDHTGCVVVVVVVVLVYSCGCIVVSFVDHDVVVVVKRMMLFR